MAINKKTWAGGELISQSGLNQTSDQDAVNTTDDIHTQYPKTVVSGWVKPILNFPSVDVLRAWIPFEHRVSGDVYALSFAIENDFTPAFNVRGQLWNTSFGSEAVTFISAVVPATPSAVFIQGSNIVVSKSPGTYLLKIDTDDLGSNGDGISLGFNFKLILPT